MGDKHTSNPVDKFTLCMSCIDSSQLHFFVGKQCKCLILHLAQSLPARTEARAGGMGPRSVARSHEVTQPQARGCPLTGRNDRGHVLGQNSRFVPPSALKQISRSHGPVSSGLLDRAVPPPHLNPAELTGCQPLLPPDVKSHSLCMRLVEPQQGGRGLCRAAEEGL